MNVNIQVSCEASPAMLLVTTASARFTFAGRILHRDMRGDPKIGPTSQGRIFHCCIRRAACHRTARSMPRRLIPQADRYRGVAEMDEAGVGVAVHNHGFATGDAGCGDLTRRVMPARRAALATMRWVVPPSHRPAGIVVLREDPDARPALPPIVAQHGQQMLRAGPGVPTAIFRLSIEWPVGSRNDVHLAIIWQLTQN